MKIVTEYPNNVFSWVDLSTSDRTAAKAFYGELFGWEFVDLKTDAGTYYSMANIEDHSVAGIGPQPPGAAEQGVPPVWSSYVKHDDVDAIAAKISEAGGQLIMPPMDVMQEGRMLMATDPTGAVFGVWQPRNHIGAEICNQANSLVWNELQTNDLKTAKAFYHAVFDWTSEEDQNGYVVFSAAGRAQAGGMKIEDSWGPVPPNWTVYFLVEDVESFTAKAEELGGQVLVASTDAGEMGQFSVLQDPQGAAFTVMQFNAPASPPPGH